MHSWFYFFRYDLIAKTETSNEDTYCVFLNTGIDKIFRVEDRKHENVEGASGDTAPILFKELTKSQVDRLYEWYKFDFEAFGYEHESYRNVAK